MRSPGPNSALPTRPYEPVLRQRLRPGGASKPLAVVSGHTIARVTVSSFWFLVHLGSLAQGPRQWATTMHEGRGWVANEG
jgi:hypothetical protein